MKTLLLLLLFLPFPSSALNLGEIRTDVRSLITDGQGTRQRFSDSELNRWINEGQRIADVTTLCTEKAYDFETVIGTTYYAMPDDFLAFERVTRDFLSIQEMTQAGLDGRSAEWENQTGLPTYYYIDFSSRTRLAVVPVPGVSSDTGTIRVEYQAFNTTMSSDTDVPFGGIIEFYPYHYILSFYAAYKASVVDERDNKAKIYLDSFGATTKVMKDQCKARPNYRPQMSARQ